MNYEPYRSQTFQQGADCASGEIQPSRQVAIGRDRRRRLITERTDGGEEYVGTNAFRGDGGCPSKDLDCEDKLARQRAAHRSARPAHWRGSDRQTTM